MTTETWRIGQSQTGISILKDGIEIFTTTISDNSGRLLERNIKLHDEWHIKHQLLHSYCFTNKPDMSEIVWWDLKPIDGTRSYQIVYKIQRGHYTLATFVAQHLAHGDVTPKVRDEEAHTTTFHCMTCGSEVVIADESLPKPQPRRWLNRP